MIAQDNIPLGKAQGLSAGAHAFSAFLIALPSGMYFCKLMCCGETVVKQITIIK
jgi:hypothetical protein